MKTTLEVQSRPAPTTYEWVWREKRDWQTYCTVSTPEEGEARFREAKKDFGNRRDVRLVEIKTIITDEDIK